MQMTIIVNGAAAQVTANADVSLLDVLRDELGCTGPKFGCGEGACGACTVLVGRRAVTACTTTVAQVAGERITTIEGLAEQGVLHPVQQAWLETGAMQCGYCTPGWLMATAALLAATPHPDDTRIAAGLAGNVCRCCTYPRILRAIHRAAELLDHPAQLPAATVGSMPLAGAALPSAAGLALPSAAGLGQPSGAGLGQLPAERAATGSAATVLPWDQAAKDAESFFELLPDGLVTVVTTGENGPNLPGGWGAPDDAWVHVGADDTVTAFTGKVEAGQGTRTALALLVAEELAVPVGSVRLVMGNTDISPYDMGTFGSRSMPYAAPPLRAAAAAAREWLLDAAARRLHLAAGELSIAGGLVAGPDGAPSVRFGELLAGLRHVEQVPADRPVTPAPRWRSAGHPAPAVGAQDVVTGAKRFPSDLRIDGMLHGCVLRPPAYGAALRRLDSSAAQTLPDVAVIREDGFTAVVAPDHVTARRAIGLIEAAWDFSPQPGSVELGTYLRAHPIEGAGWSGPFHHDQGDVAAALAAGPVRLTAHYSTAYIAHVPLEPRAALASWENGRVTVWVGSSTPFRTRREVADAVGAPEASVRIVVPDYGGGFGGKHGGTVAVEAARLSRAVGRPVRVAWNRDEEFRCGYLRPAALIDVSSSMDSAGLLTGWAFTNINSGAAGILSPYRIPHQQISYQPADSPVPQGSYRALAATANHFARESHMDEMAGEIGADPLAFRLRHLEDDRLAAVLLAAAEPLGWDETGRSAGAQADRTGTGRPAATRAGRIGTGVAAGMEKGGRVATAAQVRVADDGTLQVLRLVTAFDCGAIVNPDNVANQVEGAVMMGLGGALFEEIDFAGGRIRNASLAKYRVPRLPDLPAVEVILLDRPDQPSAGGGETPIVAVAPAIANAIADACGARLRSLPLARDGKIPGH
jgi:nicotinate dehydrogenase subunit B